MVAETPTLTPAITAVREYSAAHMDELSPQQAQTLLEVERRLERLEVQAAELIEINNRLWAREGFGVSFDPESDTIIVSFGDHEQRLKLNRADPDVPMSMRLLSATSAYHAGMPPHSDEEEQVLRIELEEKLESYYQSAHRVLKLFGTIPALSKIRCLPITRVRNNLIEHPDTGALYSFGVGSTGPRVKPLYRGNHSFNDEGLVPNTREFVEAIASGCRDRVP